MTSEDQFLSNLDEIIDLFLNYKPGRITLDNITKLCQTLGLESFIDDIDSNLSRLSTASKIIVVDIDFDKSMGKVKDVKLVLASNFDNFNYYTDQSIVLDVLPKSLNESENNILLNSLTKYTDLKEFYQNLKYIYFLDTYSSIESDTSKAPTNANNSSNVNNSSANINTTTSNNNESLNNENVTSLSTPSISISGTNNVKSSTGADSNNQNNEASPSIGQTIDKSNCKLDLFKYYTELADYFKRFFISNNSNYKIITNLNDIFGIYIIQNDDISNPIAKIYLEKSVDPKNRLFEFIYSNSDEKWINEDFDNYTTGVSLVMEILDLHTNNNNCKNPIWFPMDLIPADIILQSSENYDIVSGKEETSLKNSRDSNNNHILDLFLNNIKNSHNTSLNDHLIYNGRYRLINDFTTSLINISKFDISNDNLELILEILNWIDWSNMVLQPIFNIISKNNNSTTNVISTIEKPNAIIKNENNESQMLVLKSRRASGRRSSTLAKRPSIVEASILKDEGLQQFNLHEIMAQPVIEDEEDNNLDGIKEVSNVDSEIPNDNGDIDMADASDINFSLNGNSDLGESQTRKHENIVNLIISEDHISLENITNCNIYDNSETWITFIEKLKENIEV